MRHLCEWTTLAENRWTHVGRKLTATQTEHPYDIAAAVLEAFRRTWPECLKEAPHSSNVVIAALIVLIDVFIDQKWPDADAHAAPAHQRRVPGAVS